MILGMPLDLGLMISAGPQLKEAALLHLQAIKAGHVPELKGGGPPKRNSVFRSTLSMTFKQTILTLVGLAVMSFGTSASAEALRSNVDFNTKIGQQTEDQPDNGVTVAYQITLQGGDLDGCTVDVVESLYGRAEGTWGIFDIAGDVTCDNGGFAYTSSGAWDGNGFHAAGEIEDGSGTGEFEGIVGRVAQLGGSGGDAGDGTFDIAYELVIDRPDA
jgi:hypothetical protein